MTSAQGSTGSFSTMRVRQTGAVQRDIRGLFVITAGEGAGRVIPFSRPGQAISFGRGPECAVQFRSQSISRLHASAVWVGNQYIVTDAGSTNGTFVNDRRIERSAALDNGDQVRLGPELSLRFSIVDADEARALITAGEGNARDALTGVYGRSHLEHVLDDELSKARRCGTPLSALMIDVDRFKAVNDSHGHLAGDEVLAGLAREMSSCIRNSDILARYGGEEFVVVAPGTNLTAAHCLAERLRIGIEAATFTWGACQFKITVSIGVASLACCGAEPDRLTLLFVADQRTYLAKRARNAVVSKGGSPALIIAAAPEEEDDDQTRVTSA